MDILVMLKNSNWLQLSVQKYLMFIAFGVRYLCILKRFLFLSIHRLYFIYVKCIWKKRCKKLLGTHTIQMVPKYISRCGIDMLHKIKSCNKATIFMNQLLLTLFSSFDIKWKKLNVKNLWKCIFKGSRTVSFSYFPKVALDHGECPQCVLEILWIMLQYSIQVLCNI